MLRSFVDERTYDPQTGTAVMVEECDFYSISEPRQDLANQALARAGQNPSASRL